MAATEVDVVVIGLGVGGEEVGGRLADAGLTVVGVEHTLVGGECPYWGCIPTKMMTRAGNALAEARRIDALAGSATVAPDWAPVARRIRDEATDDWDDKVAVDRFTGRGGTFVRGRAAITGPGRVVVDGEDEYAARRGIVVATGTTAVVPPIDGLAGTPYWTNREAVECAELPASLAVLGGGAIGLELAQVYARFGVAVTVIERSERLLAMEEPESSQVAHAAVTADGVTVTGSREGRPVELHAEQLLVATGRRPATTKLDLDAVGVAVGPGGQIEVDAHLRTAHPRIWAAGDVTGGPQFVYIAAAHGAIVADNALDDASRTVDYRTLPRVTFTSPGIASAGLTEAQAIQHGYVCDCRVLPLTHVPRAIVDRDTRGLIKLVADAGTGRLLGAHVATAAAGEVIGAAVYAVANQMTVSQMAELWCPYLTMTEGLKLAAQAFTRDISRLSCCAA